MNDLPRISCVILCHNYGRYLDRAISSCLEQEPGRYVLHEVIVIDDGSTDETVEVCRRYEDRVRVIRRETKGFGPSLTDAFRLSSGDWVAPLDADDWFHASKLRTCADAITDGRLFIEHWEHVVDAEGRPFLAEPHPGGNTSTLLAHREAALTLLPVTNEIFFHALREAGHGHALRVPLVYYRLHPLSMTDRHNRGVSQLYRAEVSAALARRLRTLTADPPSWTARRDLHRMSRHFRALGAGHLVEAQVQLGRRRTCLRPLITMLIDTAGSRRSFAPWVSALSSALTGRPQVSISSDQERRS
ncbi:glycosyltransferase [Streptomyces sp. NPDC091201]|uniref:glycosyltransferase n=1 Tax=Streptomyces sp. NPDC091201 TaxID=3155190 RepID=UPI003421F37E